MKWRQQVNTHLNGLAIKRKWKIMAECRVKNFYFSETSMDNFIIIYI